METEGKEIPWRRDYTGKPILRKATGTCSVCNKIIYDSINKEKLVICGICTQSLLGMGAEVRETLREKLRSKYR